MKTKEEVLRNSTLENNVLKLPNIQLDRKLYQDVAKSIELIGGKWKGGKISGFVFQNDPTELLEQITNNNNLKKEYQFFATPDNIANYLVQLAEIQPNDTILEPSAGQGAIIKAINNITNIVPDCYELMETNTIILKNSNLKFNLLGNDFLQHDNKLYSKIIANPPFTKNQDIIHLLKMYDSLKPKGKLVCITSLSWTTGNQKKQIDFRKWLENNNASILDLDKGMFKNSGTMIETKIIVVDKM